MFRIGHWPLLLLLGVALVAIGHTLGDSLTFTIIYLSCFAGTLT